MGLTRQLRLVWVDATGATETVLEQEAIAEYSRLGGVLSLTRDGARVVLGGAGDIAVVDLERRVARRLTDSASNDMRPFWSTDEERVLFSSNRENGWSIWSVPANSGGDAEPFFALSGRVGVADVASDGAVLVHESRADGTGHDLHVLAAGGELEPFVATSANEVTGSFSPNAAWIAYQSDTTGRDEVFVLPRDGRGAPVQISVDGGECPRWSPTGTALYFRRGRAVLRVDVREGRPVGDAAAVFTAPNLMQGMAYAIAPDETRLLAVQLDDAAIPDEIRVVTGFFDEIERVAGSGGGR